MKTVSVALFAIVSVASAQKFFFSDVPGVAPAPSVPLGGPLVPGVPGGPLVPGLPGFPATPLAAPSPAFNGAPAFAPAAPAPVLSQYAHVPIIEHTQIKNADGSSNLRYETANGIAQQEVSSVGVNSRGEPTISKTGSYGFTAPDGTPVSISYIADENGFRVSGNPLPVAPAPVPAF